VSPRPIPPHGTYARGNGSPGYRKPCPCQPCLNARRRGKKRNTVQRQLGRPGTVDAAQAQARLLTLNKTTGWNDLAAAIGGSAANLRDIAAGRRTTIRRATHNKIMALAVQPSGGQYIEATGSRRRIHALRAIGWSTSVIAKHARTSDVRIQLISNGQATVRHSLTVKIREAYDTLSLQTPVGRDVTRVKNTATRNGWAPPGAWDDDCIDDPAAVPDWTGYCGTDRGYWMHRNQQLPMCARCETAHEAWLTERAELTARQLNQEKFRARAAAASREADLAADARELMRYGTGIEQAAARLKVTRQHLQQALLRSPEATPPQQTDMQPAA